MALNTLAPWNWSKHTLDLLTALGTAGAVIVVLVVSLTGWIWRGLRTWRRRPLPELSFDAKSNINAEAISFDEGTTRFPAAYVRLTVHNPRRRQAAESVQVLITRVAPVGPLDPHLPPGQEYEAHDNLGPLPWTHSAETILILGPGASRTVDLGYLVETTDPGVFTIPLPTNPLSGVQFLPGGTYQILLAVVGANFDAKNYELTLWHDGAWTSEQPISEQFGLDLHSGPQIFHRRARFPKDTSSRRSAGR